MKKILVGLDASKRADDVLDTAVNLARAFGGELVLVRVVGIPSELPREAYALAPDDVASLLTDKASQALATLKARVPESIPVSVRVETGTAWSRICAAADDLHVDLIVMGSHGYTGLDHVIGTTAAKVTNHARCSVLVVRQKALRPE